MIKAGNTAGSLARTERPASDSGTRAASMVAVTPDALRNMAEIGHQTIGNVGAGAGQPDQCPAEG